MKRLSAKFQGQAQGWLTRNGIPREYGDQLLSRVLAPEVLTPLSKRLFDNSIRESERFLARLKITNKETDSAGTAS